MPESSPAGIVSNSQFFSTSGIRLHKSGADSHFKVTKKALDVSLCRKIQPEQCK